MIFQLELQSWPAAAAKFVVLIASFRTEVCFLGQIDTALINLIASIACCVPFSERSAQPNQ